MHGTFKGLKEAGNVLTLKAYWSAVLRDEGVDVSRAEQVIRYWDETKDGASNVFGRSLVLSIRNQGLITDDHKLAQYVANRHGTELCLDLRPDVEVVRQFTADKCKAYCMVPLGGGTVAVADPEIRNFSHARAEMGRVVRNFRLVIAPIGLIQEAIDQVVSDSRRSSGAASQQDEGNLSWSQVVERDLEDVFRSGASDLHLKPGEEASVVTARIDGECREIRRLAPENKEFYAKALKLSSNRGMDGEAVGEHVEAVQKHANAALNPIDTFSCQDGKSTRIYGGKRVALRYSSIPAAHGESIVVRFIDHARIETMKLTDLGYLPADEETMRAAFRAREGINMLLGSTGSGKTTSLYCGVKEVDMVKSRVIFVEDPIECVFKEGPIQIEVSELVPFDDIKRSVVRHDPDVIVISEVRDPKSVQVLAWAFLSSHLVWSTLHSSSPFLAIRRLIELKLDTICLAASVDVFCAQVLAKRVCPRCRQVHPQNEMYKSHYKDLLDRYEVREPCFFRRNPTGCPVCDERGDKGRLLAAGEKGRVLFAELHKFTEEDKALIGSLGDKYDPVAARNIARNRPNPLKTMREDAIIKAAMGWVTIEEALAETAAPDAAASGLDHGVKNGNLG